ncbi:MAG: hypothetical protein K0U64_08870, partial [Actinomycetia bacterium]|nr:hypothetical protein [Actinomycetes bacterium]
MTGSQTESEREAGIDSSAAPLTGSSSTSPSNEPADAASGEVVATNPAQPTAGRTLAGRIARRLTGGPGSRVFEAGVGLRRSGYWMGAKAVEWRGRTRRLQTSAEQGHAAVRVAGYPVQARVIDDATILQEHQRLLAQIADQLEVAGAQYFLVPAGDGFHTIGLRPKSRHLVGPVLA